MWISIGSNIARSALFVACLGLLCGCFFRGRVGGDGHRGDRDDRDERHDEHRDGRR